MEEKLTNLDLITKHLDGELSGQEKQTFEKSLQQADFAEEVAFYKEMVSVVQETGESEEEDFLKDIDLTNINSDIRADLVVQNERLKNREISQPKATVRRLYPMRRMLSIAASILVLVAVGTFWYANTTYSTTALSATHYLTADIPGTMGGNDGVDANLQEGLNAFWVKKDLAAAKTAFAKISTESKEYTEAQYFLGHIAFQEKNYSVAKEKYQQVLATNSLPNYINRDKLNWNLLLARLGNGENIAGDLQQILDNENHPLYIQAKALQAQMDGFWGNFFN